MELNVVFVLISLLILIYLLLLNIDKRNKMMNLTIDKWFFVSFNEIEVKIYVNPPNGNTWEEIFYWDSINKICYQFEDVYTSDGLYIYTTLRKNPFIIPLECNGGEIFIMELIKKNLINRLFLNKVHKMKDGERHCITVETSNNRRVHTTHRF